MGLGGLRANFLSSQRQRKCGRKDCQKHISRPKRIGVCYGFVASFFSVLFSFCCLNAKCLFVLLFSQSTKLSEYEKVRQSQSKVFPFSYAVLYGLKVLQLSAFQLQSFLEIP